MKVWLDSNQLTGFGLTPNDVASAIKRQNTGCGRAHRRATALPDQQFSSPSDQGRLSSVEFQASWCAPIRTLVRARARCRPGRARRLSVARTTRWPSAAVIGLYQSPGGSAIDSAERTASCWQLKSLVSGGRRLQDHLRHDRIRRESIKGVVHVVRRLRPGRHRGVPVPQGFGRPYPDRRAGILIRHVFRDAGARLLGQYRVAARPGPRHRHRGRRRDRRGQGSRRIWKGPDAHPAEAARRAMEITPIIAITLVLLSVFVRSPSFRASPGLCSDSSPSPCRSR